MICACMKMDIVIWTHAYILTPFCRKSHVNQFKALFSSPHCCHLTYKSARLMISAVLPPPLKPRLIFFPFSTWAVPRQGVVLPAGLLIMHNCYTSALSLHIPLNIKSFAINSKCIRNREESLNFPPKSRQIQKSG